MNPTNGFFTRRQLAENQMVDLARANVRAASKAGRISTAPRVIRGLDGKPIGGAQSPFQTITSANLAREQRVAQSMQDGTFAGIRDRYNRDNPGMWMNNFGSITRYNPYIHGGQLGSGPSSVAPAAPATPGKPAVPPTQVKPAAPAPMGPPSNRGRIFDNGVDVTEDIQKGLAGNRTGGIYRSANPHGAMMAQAQKVQDAAKGITEAQQSIDATQRILNNNFGTKPGAATPATPPVASTPTQAPAVPAPQKLWQKHLAQYNPDAALQRVKALDARMAAENKRFDQDEAAKAAARAEAVTTIKQSQAPVAKLIGGLVGAGAAVTNFVGDQSAKIRGSMETVANAVGSGSKHAVFGDIDARKRAQAALK